MLIDDDLHITPAEQDECTATGAALIVLVILVAALASICAWVDPPAAGMPLERAETTETAVQRSM